MINRELKALVESLTKRRNTAKSEADGYRITASGLANDPARQQIYDDAATKARRTQIELTDILEKLER